MKIITKITSNRHIFLVTLIGLSLVSCKKFVVIGPPASEVSNEKVFNDEGATLSAVLGVYQDMRSSSLYPFDGASTLYPALSADELLTISTNPDILSFLNNSIIADNGTGIYSRLWAPLYRTVYYSNAVIEGLEKSEKLNRSVKNKYLGEMLVVRSLCYFYLINFFGDAPLELTTYYRSNSVMPRITTEKIYNQIILDLQRAKTLLIEDYPSVNKARPNLWAATALLARIYLFKKDWLNASIEASAIIASKKYELEEDLNSVFLMNSKECIWQVHNDFRNTGEGAAFIPSAPNAKPTYIISKGLAEEFEEIDQRKRKWMQSTTIDGKTVFYPFKYKVRGSSPVTESYTIIRLSEIYLILAESLVQLNDLDGGQLNLNRVHKRAGLGEISEANKEHLLNIVYKERQKELFCEFGFRWLDLKRLGLADDVLGQKKSPNWQSTDKLYPIPMVELQRNSYLKQNEGY